MFSLKKLNLKHLHSFFFAPKQAFTLVELIVVISVLAVLATISFSQVGNITKNARDASRTTSISNIKGSLEIFYAQKGRYPFPDNPTTLTGAGNSKLYKGVITTAVLPGLNTDTKDPTTNAPYQYATLSNTHYQIGTNLEGTTSLQSITNQTFADSTTTNTIPYIKGNYTFDPSLPSLFPIGTSSGIFSPTTCFILESSDSPNNFSSTSAGCTPKAQTSFKNLDTSLVGYWDMETKTGTLLKDLTGNGNDGVFSGGMDYTTALTGGILGSGMIFNGSGQWIKTLSGSPGTANSLTFFMKPKQKAYVNASSNFHAVIQINRTFSGAWSDSALYFMNNVRKLNIYNVAYSEQLLDFDTMYFVVYTNDSKYVRLYINGRQIEIGRGANRFKKEILTNDQWANWELMGIGGAHANMGDMESYYGLLDEVKVYNRALSSEEILQQAKIAGF